ncbi:hypothetical protein ACFCX4_20475 [Kitasatospora sp. NPDC056327]|uniref:hypothetical protein n=1 Tax=Kitasatospora sp. NPDC056327 TaxID=3345785 RepID=UPI0035DFD928
MKPRPGVMAPLLYAVVVTLSALAALAVGWPIRHGPLGPWLLVVGLVFATGVTGALPAPDAWVPRHEGTTPPERIGRERRRRGQSV